jgi:hypothetical protein
MSRYARIREACQYGRFGLTKCYDLINAGKIDAYKDEGRTLVDLDSIDRYNKTLPKFVPGSKKTPKSKSVTKHAQ